MIMDGLIITITGMGTVFSFLILLVFAMSIMAKVVEYLNKIMPEEVATPATVPARSKATEDEVAVAIAVARMNMN